MDDTHSLSVQKCCKQSLEFGVLHAVAPALTDANLTDAIIIVAMKLPLLVQINRYGLITTMVRVSNWDIKPGDELCSLNECTKFGYSLLAAVVPMSFVSRCFLIQLAFNTDMTRQVAALVDPII